MNWSIIITILFLLLFLRIFWAHVKTNNAQTQSFQNLEAKDKLAVLKECLLNDPTEKNLENLGNFLRENQLEYETESYLPLLKRQLVLVEKKEGVEKWDELYIEQSLWLDKIEPLEFKDARDAFQKGDKKSYICFSLEGISRLYSDEAIEQNLSLLKNDYPKALKLLSSYKDLVKKCNESKADEDSLKKLRKERDKWIEDLLNFSE